MVGQVGACAVHEGCVDRQPSNHPSRRRTWGLEIPMSDLTDRVLAEHLSRLQGPGGTDTREMSRAELYMPELPNE